MKSDSPKIDAVRGGGQNLAGFSKEDTDVAKGIALCLLLIHHLFYQHPEIGPFIYGTSLPYAIGRVAKVCVAMFLILSGYGLNESTRKPTGLSEFYVKRIGRIYLNYWFVWIVFVPLSVLLFDRDLAGVYGSYAGVKMLMNVFGVHCFFGVPSYNATWWFVSLIIGMYLLFPFLKVLCAKFGWWFLVVVACALIFDVEPRREQLNIAFLAKWLLPFSLGIYLSQVNGLYRLSCVMDRRRLVKACLYVLLAVCVVAQRHVTGVRLDGLLGLMIILIGYEYLSKARLLRASLQFVGKHSFNIFLFHTFILAYFFREAFYSLSDPLLMFGVLLAVCLALSVALDKLMSVCGAPYLGRRLYSVRIDDGITV